MSTISAKVEWMHNSCRDGTVKEVHYFGSALSEELGTCQADLEEAGQIAERGSMKLFMADVHLHRARLFRDKAALAEARKLIAQHGYHRRDEELHDAEQAARNW